MAEQGPKRKPATILSADVAGYSRLMGDDGRAWVEHRPQGITLAPIERGRSFEYHLYEWRETA